GSGEAGRPGPVHTTVGRHGYREYAGPAPESGHPGLHDQRAEDRLHHRISSFCSVPCDRSGGRQRADVDGHDDAAAGGGQPALQTDLLRAGGRVETGRGQPRRELPESLRRRINPQPARPSGRCGLAKFTKTVVDPPVLARRFLPGDHHWENTLMTTQAELIAAVAKDAGVSQADAGKVLTAIVENIHKALKSGDAVRISHLAVFDTADRADREGRNPATGATVKIRASEALRFRVSKPLKDAVNG